MHLLAIDNDTQILTNLFAYSGTLAPRAVIHNSGGDLLGSVRKEGDLFHVDGMYVLVYISMLICT